MKRIKLSKKNTEKYIKLLRTYNKAESEYLKANENMRKFISDICKKYNKHCFSGITANLKNPEECFLNLRLKQYQDLI